MDKDFKKQVGLLVGVIILGFSWYLVDLLPTLVLSGRDLALLTIIVGAVVKFLLWTIEKLTGVKPSDITTPIIPVLKEEQDQDDRNDEEATDEESNE